MDVLWRDLHRDNETNYLVVRWFRGVKTTIFDRFIEKEEEEKKWKIDERKKKKCRNEARIHRFSRRVSRRPLTRIEKLASSIVPRNKHGSLPKSEEIRAA